MLLKDDLSRLTSAYQAGRSLALLFDFDGTLAPLVTHPDLAACSPRTEELLASLAGLPRVIVGIVSGRTLANLKSKISLPGVIYAGTFGLEMELPSGLVEHPDSRRYVPVVQAAKEAIAPIIKDYKGAWIEDKPLALTVHYRQVWREEIAFLRQCVESKLSRFDGVLVSIDGSMAMEVMPDIGWDKGEALHTIIEQDGREAIPLFAGNDDNDAGAMQAALDRGGVVLGIGPLAPPFASHRLSDVDCLTECLDDLLKHLSKSSLGVPD